MHFTPGSHTLSFEIGGFHWGDDIVIALTTGQIDFDTGSKGLA